MTDHRRSDDARLDRIDAAFKAAMRNGLEEGNAVRRTGPPLEILVHPVGRR